MERCNPEEMLRRYNLKLTKQRLMVLEKIIEIQEPFTAYSLFDLLDESMDLVTIYRNLNTLKEKMILREIPTESETRLFELSCIHNPVHPHFYCSKCKKTYCLDEISKKDLDILKSYYTEGHIDGVVVQLSGICANCK